MHLQRLARLVINMLVFAAWAMAPSSVETLSPQIAHASIFSTGLVMVLREAEVPAGLHSYRLKNVPEALDNTLWFDSPDGAEISDIVTHLSVETTAKVTDAATILDYVRLNVGNHLEFDCAPVGVLPPVHVSGKLISFNAPSPGYGIAYGTLDVLSNGTLSEFTVQEIKKLSLKGLVREYKAKQVRPDIAVVFKVRAKKPGHIRFCSLEAGAAWNASYRLQLEDKTAEVTAKSQVAVAGLRLDNTDVDLVTGMPDVSRAGRLDLTTGLASLDEWLASHSGPTVPVPQPYADPYAMVAKLVSQRGYGEPYSQFAGVVGGGMGGGGGGLAPARIDLISYNPADNSLVLDRARFIERAIQAARLEDLFTYPLGHIDLEPGERLTRVLSKTTTSAERHYVWEINLLPGGSNSNTIRSVLSLNNNSGAAWPRGTVFITRNNTPLSEVEMPFTSPGKTADLDIGKADDIIRTSEVREMSREDLDYNRTGWHQRVHYQARIKIENTRLETMPLDIHFQILGQITSAAEAKIERTAKVQSLDNPSMMASWHLDLSSGQKKEFVVEYTVEI